MFKVEIKTGGAVFRSEHMVDKYGDYILDHHAYEVRIILKNIVKLLSAGETDGKIMDSNGNKVGWWSYE